MYSCVRQAMHLCYVTDGCCSVKMTETHYLLECIILNWGMIFVKDCQIMQRTARKRKARRFINGVAIWTVTDQRVYTKRPAVRYFLKNSQMKKSRLIQTQTIDIQWFGLAEILRLISDSRSFSVFNILTGYWPYSHSVINFLNITLLRISNRLFQIKNILAELNP